MALTNQQALRRASADLALNKTTLSKEARLKAEAAFKQALKLSLINKESVQTAKLFMDETAGFDDFGKAAVYLSSRFLAYARAELRSFKPKDRGPTVPGSPMLMAA